MIVGFVNAVAASYKRLAKITQETSTSVNTLNRLDNNEHRINQRRSYRFNCPR